MKKLVLSLSFVTGLLFITSVAFGQDKHVADTTKPAQVQVSAPQPEAEKGIMFALTNKELALLGEVIDKSTAPHTMVKEILNVLNNRITEQLKMEAEAAKRAAEAKKEVPVTTKPAVGKKSK